MTKQEFINKYIYGIDNDALTDNQEAIDMSNDLGKYVTEQLRQQHVVGRSERLVCDVCGSTDVIEAPHMGRNCNRCHPLGDGNMKTEIYLMR